MGELHRKAHALPPVEQELVTVTVTLPKASWALLTLRAQMDANASKPAQDLYVALQKAIVVPGKRGEMAADIAGCLAAYDADKVMAELKEFFESEDEGAPSNSPTTKEG